MWYGIPTTECAVKLLKWLLIPHHISLPAMNRLAHGHLGIHSSNQKLEISYSGRVFVVLFNPSRYLKKGHHFHPHPSWLFIHDLTISYLVLHNISYWYSILHCLCNVPCSTHLLVFLTFSLQVDGVTPFTVDIWRKTCALLWENMA
jgi:hypothetical protein